MKNYLQIFIVVTTGIALIFMSVALYYMAALLCY